MHFRTRAIHVGNERESQTGAVVPPIHVASTYVQPGAGEWGAFDYSRSGDETHRWHPWSLVVELSLLLPEWPPHTP